MNEELMYIKKFIENKDNENNHEELFYYLNLSIISGEYLKNFTNFRNTIENFKDINSIYESINPDNISSTNNDNVKEILNIELFENAIKFYKELAENINDNIKVYLSEKNENRSDVKPQRLKIKYEIEKLFYEKNILNNSKIAPGYFLFLINLSLAELDEYLECNDKCLEEIYVFQKYFQDKLINSISDKWQSPIIKILKDKCDFLEFKINFRKNKATNLINFENNAFNQFYQETKNHYFIDNKTNECSKFIHDCCISIDNFSFINDLSAKKAHQINKFLKRTNLFNNAEKLGKITDVITQINFSQKEKEFEKVSYDSASNLLQNTKLSIVLEEEKNSNFKNFICENLLKENILIENNKFINNIKVELERDNLDYRGFEYVIDFFNVLFERLQNFSIQDLGLENVTIENLKTYFEKIKKNVNDIFKFYEESLNKLENNKKHLNSFELKPIYLELNDCIKKINIISPFNNEQIEIDIFLDSSYILPIDFEKVDNKIKENRLTYKIKKQIIEASLDSLFDLESAKLKLNEVESKFKENDFKIVQIVAMFVSIATFVLLNVKIFDNKSGFESIAILFGLGGVFTLFNGFFNWLILGQIKNDHRNRKDYFSIRIFFTSGVLVVISMIILWFHNGESIIEKVDTKLNGKIDSLINLKSQELIENYKSDSINRLLKDKDIDNRIKILEAK